MGGVGNLNQDLFTQVQRKIEDNKVLEKHDLIKKLQKLNVNLNERRSEGDSINKGQFIDKVKEELELEQFAVSNGSQNDDCYPEIIQAVIKEVGENKDEIRVKDLEKFFYGKINQRYIKVSQSKQMGN